MLHLKLFQNIGYTPYTAHCIFISYFFGFISSYYFLNKLFIYLFFLCCVFIAIQAFMMNEISQTEKSKHCEILLIRGIEKTKPEAKLIDRENRL